MTERPPEEVERELIRRQVARLRSGILAVVFGLVCGTGLWLATVWLLIRGGPEVGEHLGLLRHYYPGYSVTWTGSVIGFVYGALTGAVIGWSVGSIYNLIAFRTRR